MVQEMRLNRPQFVTIYDSRNRGSASPINYNVWRERPVEEMPLRSHHFILIDDEDCDVMDGRLQVRGNVSPISDERKWCYTQQLIM
jgi:hypothetical protein